MFECFRIIRAISRMASNFCLYEAEIRNDIGVCYASFCDDQLRVSSKIKGTLRQQIFHPNIYFPRKTSQQHVWQSSSAPEIGVD